MTLKTDDISKETNPLPGWLPDPVRHYVAHVERGVPIRALARRAGQHPSTILRQIRRVEARRDDPLVEGCLGRLAGLLRMVVDETGGTLGTAAEEGPFGPGLPDQWIAALRPLCEEGATLVVGRDMDRCVVVSGGPEGDPENRALVERPVAETLALRELVASDAAGGRIARYRVTSAGRVELRRLVNAFTRAGGLEEAAAPFVPQPDAPATLAPAESPLAGLGRRRDRDGRPFLDRGSIAAGERLREDFQLAEMGPRTPGDWTRYLTGGELPPDRPGTASDAARARVAAALAALGPGLGDVALRCCCYLEGLEDAERRMGWSARSGKVVLRIALQRLRQHYSETPGAAHCG
ncbi:DUF6456 domain-containing protein [Histidinibacterium aquaticum]|uniref:Helix-turn-helix domain-containing protein n=1 Tax=Histidinibacterium aquaticum TaxID=2613962 RepID=A0A5J5GP40_9RHOB|nr:DUF6456 domain-containing protein [Histidinibacterium aquaticum]KAA9009212.1 helix-turn-helix domain-containing protein [Histidinibacterium aquaticum]